MYFANGKSEGIMTSYTRDGSLKETGNYSAGNKEGEFTRYDETGTVIDVATFREDKEI